jgi:hypothetical protein
MKTFEQFIELLEASYVSNSPSTGASVGVKFDVKKNTEKSVGNHANDMPVEHHDVYHEGKHIGHVSSYSGYKDTKAPGSRVVSTRKNVRNWSTTVFGNEHNRHGSHWESTPAGSQYTSMEFTSKKYALQHLADAHKSNTNR